MIGRTEVTAHGDDLAAMIGVMIDHVYYKFKAGSRQIDGFNFFQQFGFGVPGEGGYHEPGPGQELAEIVLPCREFS